jgi:hypothetical protein
MPSWSRGDSNPGPPPCKGGALPTKLRPPPRVAGHVPRRRVGAPGLEPGTSALSGPRSNQLSYAPVGHLLRSTVSADRLCAEDEAMPTPRTPRRGRVSRTSTARGRPCRAATTVTGGHRTPRLGPPLPASPVLA